MSDKRRDIRKAKRTPGESEQNARQRARIAAQQAAKRKRERKILIGSAVGLLVLVLIAGGSIQLYRMFANPNATAGTDIAFSAEAIKQGQPVKFGKPEAPVTLTVFSDFKCPHCQTFEEQFAATIKAKQDAGELTLETVPMAFLTPESFTMTNAYGCAVQQNAGQAYYAGLFANPDLQWTDEQLVALGSEVNPDMPTEFETCVTRKKNETWVNKMNAYATERGVESTPTLYLGDEQVELQGLTPQLLESKIDDAANR